MQPSPTKKQEELEVERAKPPRVEYVERASDDATIRGLESEVAKEKALLEAMSQPDHVAHRDPLQRHRPAFDGFGLHGRKVVLHEERAGGQVGLVELVRDGPADRPELAALDQDGVHEALDVQDVPPLRPRPQGHGEVDVV